MPRAKDGTGAATSASSARRHPHQGVHAPGARPLPDAVIKDLSGGGLQIETRQYFPEKTLLKIEMNFSGWQRYTRAS